MRDSVRFWFRGEIVDVHDLPATTTVLQWLRTTGRSLGTKEGCNEGDCGACAVVVGRPDDADGLDLRVAHACLLLLPMLDGCALITVEDLASGGVLHPVQQAMVEHRGSQCGYCTPGIVMSLWHLHQTSAGTAVCEDDVRTALAGHLCRCTGYRSIVEAAITAADEPAPAFDGRPARAALDASGGDTPLDYRAAGTTWVAPTTLPGLLHARADRPSAVVVAGGTDLVPAVPGRGELPADWISTAHVRDLARLAITTGGLSLGGGVSIEAAWSALTAQWPHLEVGWRRFASPPIRRQGTLAGNLVTASPVGDTAPVLLAVDARVVLASPRGERTIDVGDFVTGYRTTALAPDEVLVRVEVRGDVTGWDVRMAKVARRFDNDIATVSLATALDLDDEGVVREVRVALGGVAAVPLRARSAEDAIRGRAWDRDALTAAQIALASDCSPLSDHRGSAEYRLAAARGLLERWWLQTRPVDPLPPTVTEVWGST